MVVQEEPLFRIGEKVRHNGLGYRVIALDGVGPVIIAWLRQEHGPYYTTAATRELERAE